MSSILIQIAYTYMHMHTNIHTCTHRHLVEAGIWKTRQLAGPTIQQALLQWYNNRTVPMHFRDNCSGLHCNNQCPETFTLGELDSDDWPPAAKAIIVALVLGVTIVCLIAKGIFCIWLCCLQRKQHDYRSEEGEKIQASSFMLSLSVSYYYNLKQ